MERTVGFERRLLVEKFFHSVRMQNEKIRNEFRHAIEQVVEDDSFERVSTRITEIGRRDRIDGDRLRC